MVCAIYTVIARRSTADYYVSPVEFMAKIATFSFSQANKFRGDLTIHVYTLYFKNNVKTNLENLFQQTKNNKNKKYNVFYIYIIVLFVV